VKTYITFNHVVFEKTRKFCIKLLNVLITLFFTMLILCIVLSILYIFNYLSLNLCIVFEFLTIFTVLTSYVLIVKNLPNVLTKKFNLDVIDFENLHVYVKENTKMIIIKYPMLRTCLCLIEYS